jgi:uncharacterized protein
MKIRPHHILCTRAFRGKGYSACFIKNMQAVIKQIKTDSSIELLCGIDGICSVCPERTGSICRSEGKVQELDANTIKYLHLEKQNYPYSEIEKILDERFGEDVYNKICGKCEWKKTGVCTYADVKRTHD